MVQVEERRVAAIDGIGEAASLGGRRRSSGAGWGVAARWLMPVAAGLFVVYLLVGVGMASRWPLVHDAPLMHYVVFAMDHGSVPYRDLVEMNMPGTYVIEGAAMHLLSGGAFGWWLWDGLLGLLAVLASVWIAGPGRRSAGVVGGALAYLFHLSDGAWNLGQRDWTVAVLLLLGFGCLFAGLRERQPRWMAGFLCFCGLAASIKPPVIGIGVVFTGVICRLVARRSENSGVPEGFERSGRAWIAYLLWAGLGLAAPCALVVGFLLHWGNTRDFLAVVHGLVAYYAGLQRLGLGRLVVASFHLKVILLPALAVFLLGRRWRCREADLLLLAAVAGGALFVVQGKGWDYHLYPELAFALLWAMVEFQGALEELRFPGAVAAVTLAFATCLLAPRLLRAEHRATYPMGTLTSLQQDLTALGGSRLSGKVQCLDMTLGSCINVLYRMQLMQATGYLYDFYLFPEHGTPVTEGMQNGFLRQIAAQPPELIVLSSQSWPGDARGYAQLGNWPAFKDFLGRNYSVIREFPVQPQTAGYRIYGLHPPSVGSILR